MKIPQINTGRGAISVMVVLAIWSLSLTVNLPGLAVSPMLDRLKELFGNVSEAEVQLLTVLPNVLIIPFVLLSGKLSESHHKVLLVVISLSVYLAAGILYFFTNSMGGLIVVSCLLGCGCGVLIPFSTGLVADVFTGRYRMRQMGIISAIGNLALVAATFLVGFLASFKNWHWPFLVYLIPIVPLLLTPWLNKIPTAELDPAPDKRSDFSKIKVSASPTTKTTIVSGFYLHRTVGLVGSYFFFMSVTSIAINFLPFMMGDLNISSTAIGTVTSVLFVGMTLGGFLLTPTLRLFKEDTYFLSVVCLLVGCVLLSFFHSAWVIGAGAFFLGLANGTIQPIIYDKATECVDTPKKATLALAIIMAANYAAVALAPELIDCVRWIFHSQSDRLPFYIDLGLSVFITVVVYFRRDSFTFGIQPSYFA